MWAKETKSDRGYLQHTPRHQESVCPLQELQREKPVQSHLTHNMHTYRMNIQMCYHLKLEIRTADTIRIFSSKQTQLHKLQAQVVSSPLETEINSSNLT